MKTKKFAKKLLHFYKNFNNISRKNKKKNINKKNIYKNTITKKKQTQIKQ